MDEVIVGMRDDGHEPGGFSGIQSLKAANTFFKRMRGGKGRGANQLSFLKQVFPIGDNVNICAQWNAIGLPIFFCNAPRRFVASTTRWMATMYAASRR